jgi:hypothetical protein
MVNFRTEYRAKSPDGCDSFGGEGSPYGSFSTWQEISTRISADRTSCSKTTTEELAQRLKAQLEIVWRENGRTGTKLKDRRRDVAAKYAANIAAGELYYPYFNYPYLEWYSDNGRVVLELDPSQIMVIRPDSPPTAKSPKELVQDRKNRAKASGSLFRGLDEGSFP